VTGKILSFLNKSDWEFLLKAHYKGERENFFGSFESEPRNK
jgi:hypothetical protein